MVAQRLYRRRTLRTSALVVERLEERTLLDGGGLDLTFGKGGKVTTDLRGSLDDNASSVAKQDDGKLVVAGSSGGKISLTRYNSDGSLDLTFGPDGKVFTDVDTYYGRPASVVIRPDGQIVVVANANQQVFPVGLASGGNGALVGFQSAVTLTPPPSTPAPSYAGGSFPIRRSANDFSVVQFNPDGSLDTHFGRNGIATITIGVGLGDINGIALQADGKLLVAGSFNGYAVGSPTQSDFLLVRVGIDGTIDKTFGTAGLVTTDFANAYDNAVGVVIQADGRIIVAGTTNNYQANIRGFALARYNADGGIDTSFGSGGKVTSDFGGAQAAGVVLQTDGKIVIAGNVYQALGPIGHQNVTLARYNSNGGLDNTFGTGGKQTADVGINVSTSGLRVQGDGKIVIAGTATDPFTPAVQQASHFAVVRFQANGSLDTGFGTNGLVKTDFGRLYSSAAAITLQSDGKIVVAGRTDLHNGDYAVARYNADGTLDTRFGSSGKVTTDFQGEVYGTASAAALQADGKLVVVGPAAAAFTLVRYNADGSLDTTFGASGQVSTALESYATADSVAIQSDGFILVAGTSGTKSVLARYNPNGILDAGFGSGGLVIIDEGVVGPVGGSLSRVALEPDGKIVIAGQDNYSGPFVVLRYNRDGKPDSSFGTGGRVTTNVGSTSRVVNVAIGQDGKIVVVGTGVGPGPQYNSNVALVRYNLDGSLDTSFGTAGIVQTDNVSARGVTLQSDGRTLVAGSVASPNFQHALAVLRYNTDGSLDSSFGSGGKMTTAIGDSAEANSMAIQTDGKIVVAGDSFGNARTSLLVVRLNAEGSLDNTFGLAGKVFTHFDVAEEKTSTANQEAKSVLLQADGKIVVAGTISYYEQHNGRFNSEFAVARFLPNEGFPGPNQHFVAQLYLDLLERPVDAPGLASWSAALDQGAITRTQLGLAIASSVEYRKKLVDKLYVSLLGRSADAGGLEAFVSFLGGGGTVGQVKAFLLSSGEYFQRAGGDNTGFLSSLYRSVLGRDIDASGAATFGAALAKGAPRDAVATLIGGSAEATQDVVQSFYQRALHRPADAAGLDIFTKALQAGAREEAVLALIAGSQEYFAQL